MTAEMSPLAARIEAARNAAGLSQAELSRKAGLAAAAVNDIVTHPERSPRLSTVLALAEALDIDPIDLVGAVTGRPAAAAGTPRSCVAEIGGDLDFKAIVQALAPDCVDPKVYRIDDESARGFGFPRGSHVICDPGAATKNGDLAVVEMEGGRHAIRYVVEPYSFGFTGSCRASHEIIDHVRVKVVGRVVAGFGRRAAVNG